MPEGQWSGRKAKPKGLHHAAQGSGVVRPDTDKSAIAHGQSLNQWVGEAIRQAAVTG